MLATNASASATFRVRIIWAYLRFERPL